MVIDSRHVIPLPFLKSRVSVDVRLDRVIKCLDMDLYVLIIAVLDIRRVEGLHVSTHPYLRGSKTKGGRARLEERLVHLLPEERPVDRHITETLWEQLITCDRPKTI